MSKYRAKEEKLHRVRLGSRYFGLNIAQFYWECLKVVAGSDGLRETDILRRIIGSWTETLPATIREKARAETDEVEAWKAQELSARREAKGQTKLARLRARRARLPEEGSAESAGSFGRHRQSFAVHD